MTIIVEDGSIVTGSNSFVTRADYIAYALSIGIVIQDNSTADNHLVIAGEYIAMHEKNLIGEKVSRDQSMPYPRNNLYINGWTWLSNEIPSDVILCQINYALDLNAGEDLYNRSINPNRLVIKERVEGVVERDYASTQSDQKLNKVSRGDVFLNSLIKNDFMMSIGLVRA